jgi:hypothetical protein
MAEALTREKLVPFEDFEIHMVINFGKYSAFVQLFLYNKLKVWP